MPSGFLCVCTLGSDVINYLWIYYNFYMVFLFSEIMFKLLVFMVFVGIVASYSYKTGDSQAYWLPIHSHIPTYCYLHKNGDSQATYWVFWTVDLNCSTCYKSLLTLIVIFFILIIKLSFDFILLCLCYVLYVFSVVYFYSLHFLEIQRFW
jgi:hypothetical protein